MRLLYKLLIPGMLAACFGLSAPPAWAATLQSASDTISTSTPSTTDTPIKAVHTIKFTTVSQIPAGGSVVLRFAADSSASASASSFAFNGLSSSTIQANNLSCSYSVQAPTVTCTTGAPVSAGTTATIILGCSAQTAGSCTTPVPTIINPTKTKSAGTADIWAVQIKTLGTGGTELDVSYAKMATLDTVQVRASVSTSLTFSIAGILNGIPVNTGNATMCPLTETTNSGSDATFNTVNLGKLVDIPIQNTKISNISAQLLTVTTNSTSGYTLTATSSGHLTNTVANYSIADSATPAAFPTAQWFGIHACGKDVTSTTWNTGSDQACSSYPSGSSGNLCKYGWPASTPMHIAGASSGPVGDTIATGSGVTTIEYAAATDDTVPAGTYSATILYTLTPTF